MFPLIANNKFPTVMNVNGCSGATHANIAPKTTKKEKKEKRKKIVTTAHKKTTN